MKHSAPQLALPLKKNNENHKPTQSKKYHKQKKKKHIKKTISLTQKIKIPLNKETKFIKNMHKKNKPQDLKKTNLFYMKKDD